MRLGTPREFSNRISLPHHHTVSESRPEEAQARTEIGPGADSLVSLRVSATFGMTEHRRIKDSHECSFRQGSFFGTFSNHAVDGLFTRSETASHSVVKFAWVDHLRLRPSRHPILETIFNLRVSNHVNAKHYNTNTTLMTRAKCVVYEPCPLLKVSRRVQLQDLPLMIQLVIGSNLVGRRLGLFLWRLWDFYSHCQAAMLGMD